MTRQIRALTIAALAAAAPLFTPVAAQAANLTLCGASPGGLWSLLGVGLDAAVREADPGSTVTYQTSSGGFANIVQLKSGACDLAIVHAGEVIIAERGDAPFKEPTGGIATVALMYDKAPMHWLMGKEFADKYNISSIADIAPAEAPMSFVSNRAGILPAILAEESLKAVGLDYEALEGFGGNVQYEGSSGAAEVMQDRKADMWANATFVGTGAVNAIANARDVTLLSVPDEVIADMVERYGSEEVTIEAGAYDWLDHDVKTFGARALLVAAEDADPETIKLVAGAIRDHADKIAEVHGAMGAYTADFAASFDVLPYHPAAAEAMGITQ
ncbi:TRAP transporter [Roseovarius sp. 22II1-1F6A]|nr:TRAP transporter [Roseovarius sp. 22II1-1F6A]